MTPFDDKLRTALRETANDIPDTPPPLDLSPARGGWDHAGRRRVNPGRARRRWITWGAPLAAAAVVVAVIAGALAVTGRLPHPRPTAPAADYSGVPPYYVALTVPGTDPGLFASNATAAEVRVTATGAVLARITVPRPYAAFAAVSAAADDRTFVLLAQASDSPQPYPQNQVNYPFFRFFLLRIAPAAASPGARTSLQALPAGFVPAGGSVRDLALSPAGTALAADISGPEGTGGTQLFVFDLATGTKRAWSVKACRQCSPVTGGLNLGGINADALSWTADGRHLAFVAPATVSGPGPIGPGGARLTPGSVRLLDVSAPGQNLLTDSKVVLKWPRGAIHVPGVTWRGVVITPDGRTVVFLEQLVTYKPHGGIKSDRWWLAKGSVATGKVTHIVRNLDPAGQYEEVMYTGATGHTLVVEYFGLGYGTHVGILHGDQFTPIRWSPHIVTAAW